MKICYLSDINSVHTHKWIKYFKEKGYDIHVISLSLGEYEGVTVHSLEVEETLVKQKNDFKKISYFNKIRKVRQLIKEINPDILHAHYATSYGLLGSLANFHPYILSVWGSDVYDFPKKSYLHKLLLEYNLKRADYIFSTSNVMRKETLKYINKNIEVTPFGVDTSIFIPKERRGDYDKIVIGTVKSLEEKYGIEYLIRSFKVVKDKYSHLNLKLKIAGKGSQEEYLKELTKKLNIDTYVEFLGFLKENSVVEAFQSFDIAVFPSILDSESFGVAAVEAEACGLPVIVSDCDGLMESTKPNVTSLLAKKKDIKSLSDQIEKLVTNKELRENMGRAARKFVQDNYSLEVNYGHAEELYKNINERENLL